ncbi:retrovirus-related Pol polyprotein from transposon TNT 1-94 [Trichonephila clavipes]|uniref:Retrovirus-related Pol polyprotein from transposon TNT 1-94 n=1 Tax=Trichonephila clavipes TaxID=2585209 RepID=A0A8X6SMM6_TRICX|nr:retrovirus-related Pol polyprotein from transposon TNT 1-94 [Trichonephila clavipes]
MNSVASTLNRVTGMEFNNQISVLTPNNWNTWKHDMQVLLMHYGCWQFIIQTKPEQPDEEATYKEKLDLQLHQFLEQKYQPGEDVGIFISRVKTAATRLQEAGHKLDDLYIGFQLIRWLPQEFQSTVQQIYRWKEEDFRVVKIEAELILEANRLQLMKQDLEKAENVYLSSFTSKKSKTLPGATAAAHGDPNGKNDYQKKGGKKRAERFLSRKVIAVRTDGGLEFCNKDMDNFLTELGIKHEVTNSYTPEMNGVAERFNLTALDGIKTLLKSSEVPHKFWGEALLCFTYAWNRICHKDSNKTPFEKYSGRKPSVLHLKPFGCLAYAGVPKQIRKKFDMRAKMGIMMGYAQRTKGYRIWLIDENKLVETINDDFDRVKDSLTSRLVPKTSTEMPSTSEKPDVSSDNHSLIPCTEVKWIRNIDLSEQQEALMVEVTIPNCYKQAIRSKDASKWRDAMDKEINVMKERKVWDLVDHPDNIRILENRWVYTIK